MDPPPDTTDDRWEVTTASHTLNCSYYLVFHEPSKKTIKVIIAGKKKRTYSWNEAGRSKEPVPDPLRREIDRALIRYLSEKR
jgi:hypothetical protein